MIELRDLRKEFAGGTVALDHIDLTVPDGEIHGIVGRSGAGKSTLIRCLTGLETPTSGTITIGDTQITGRTGPQLRQARRNIGMVFQHVNLLDSRTAFGNVAHPLEIAGLSKRDQRTRAQELLELVGLADRGGSYPAQLSGGQQQRVGIARALAAEPQVLICDEPTSALDSVTTRQILGLIRDLRDKLGITVLIITHEMAVVREICDTVTLLHDGRIAQSGSLLEVISDTGSTLSKELIPLPATPLSEHQQSLVEVTLAGISLLDVLRILREAGLPTDTISAGTIETISGEQVGRVQFTTTSNTESAQLIDTLSDHGVHAEEAA